MQIAYKNMMRVVLLLALSVFAAASRCYEPPEVHCRDPCQWYGNQCHTDPQNPNLDSCADGWYGTRCDYSCASGCASCNGHDAYDCLSCYDNAHWDRRGCECDQGFTGTFCQGARDDQAAMANFNNPYEAHSGYNSYAWGYGMDDDFARHFNGQSSTSSSSNGYCDSHCSDCNGPTNKDCVTCVDHGAMDTYGYCGCDEYWSGDDCSIYGGPCHPSCYKAGGCTGATADACSSCFPHASRDAYGKCVCDPYWSGYDCSKYIGNCDSHCYGCHGTTDEDCDTCQTHAYMDDYNRCSCNSDWNGNDCNSYSGSCESHCSGCKGPEDTDCEYCTSNATWNGYGRCVCDAYWTGTDCSVYVGYCDSKCMGCTGPSATDCQECVLNASLDSYGACTCDMYWSGDCCEDYIGKCDKLCNGCHGPSNGECDYCVPHASRDKYGQCHCDEFWVGDTCSEWTGSCDAKCDHDAGCNGGSAADCFFCAQFASRDENGYCVCNEDWSGEDCRIYIGVCDPICRGCSGPDACDCETCAEHAIRDANGFCVCQNHWEGPDCSTYVGNCHPRCNGCVGPTAADCLECVENSYWDFTDNRDNECRCEAYWDGLDCSDYFGKCDLKCDPEYGCSGPDAGHCFACNENAWLRPDGDEVPMGPECDCMPDWAGKDCYLYIGPCDCLCLEQGEITCDGPGPRNCDHCIANTFRNEDGECQCLEDYDTSKDCDVYRGVCHPCCSTCDGPLSSDCIEPQPNAEMVDGECYCKSGWSADDCSLYNGECACCCNGCFGPNADDCLQLAEHAERTNEEGKEGECQCQADWRGEGSSCCPWGGACHCSCRDGCIGPDSNQCNACHENAYRNQHGECTCHKGWTGCDCSIYIGACGACCTSCSGPRDDQCTNCHGYAVFTDGSCIVPDDVYYGGLQCDVYFGVCDCKCGDNGCFGPGPDECNSCGANAGWVAGSCQCLGDWQGDCCLEYGGLCNCGCDDCSGPDLGHCGTCFENSHRDNRTGLCECDDHFSGACCDLYSGPCPCNCAQCDDEGECILCARNAHPFMKYNDETDLYVQTGECTCDDGYGGDCCKYIGECSCSCDSCVGPADWQCTKCAPNSIWENGTCVCDNSSGFYMNEDGCCEYDGPCHCNCHADAENMLSCSGPRAEDCDHCVDNALRNDDGECECHEHWDNDPSGSGSCCSHYAGPCDWRCTACVGPTNYDCVACRGNTEDLGAGCVCLPNWSGEHCDTWNGPCDCHCLGCSHGPGQEHCDLCGPNSHRVDGICTCLENWGSNEEGCCNVWLGACHCSCGGGENAVCHGPMAGDCATCAVHAYWNEYGECTCDRCWGQNSAEGCCDQYSCACNCKCADGCHGPDDDHCNACGLNATMTDAGQCVCIPEWGGPCCTEYLGKCHCGCDGCYGPGPDHCISCGMHAHRGIDGACTCDAEYGLDEDECCTIRQDPCAPTCLTCCDSNDSEACETCHSHYVLVDGDADGCGECQPCHDCCATCSGVEETQCTSCFNGYFRTGAGDCMRCPPECEECEDQGAGPVCTSCSFDSFLSAGTCQCDTPFVRDSVSRLCVDNCWHLETAVNGECVPTTDKDVLFLENVENYTVNKIQVGWCHPPYIIEQRGGYFDGKNMSLQITNWSPYPQASYSMWAKGYNPNGTLFSVDVDFWNGYNDYYNGCVGCDWLECQVAQCGVIEMWITPCGAIGVNFGNTRYVSDEDVYNGAWSYFRLSYDHNTEGLRKSTVTLELDGTEITTFDYDYLVYPRNDPEFHLGSYKGHLYNFQGFIHSYYYTIEPTSEPCNFLSTGCADGCTTCPDYDIGDIEDAVGFCLNSCDYNQYFANDQCNNCHPGCKAGCTVDDFNSGWDSCFEDDDHCHPTCHTCSGPDAEDCLTCWCGAHRTNGQTAASHCECDHGWNGSADSCMPDCADGCATCTGPETDQCLSCAHGHALNPNCKNECIPCEKEELYNADFDCATAAEPRPVTGSCMCEPNQWYDTAAMMCRDCKANCLECNDDGSCNLCDADYMFVKDLNCCYDTCATGTFENTLGTCAGDCGIIADFQFKCENAAQNINWSYTGSWDNSQTWNVKLYGGDTEDSTSADPYAVDDRGLWFDGRYSYLTVKGLVLYPTHTNIMWLKPHGDGSLFSNNRYDGGDSYILSIIGQRMTVEKTEQNYKFAPDVDFITTFVWQLTSVVAKYTEANDETVFSLYRDGAAIVHSNEPVNLGHAILDRPGWETNKIIGGYLHHDNLRGMYCGYIFQWRITSDEVTDYSDLITEEPNCANGLSVCPADGFELGICNWNSYWNGLKCARCPSWCNRGCQSDSSCTDSYDN